ncbi:hypothetical protein [Rhodopirellula bahusiensis]|uniref:hypothetical protein n=1 Tax=Rhodopirellula bahusiensis TaxID=2014065 RepID=UPI0032676875
MEWRRTCQQTAFISTREMQNRSNHAPETEGWNARVVRIVFPLSNRVDGGSLHRYSRLLHKDFTWLPIHLAYFYTPVMA